MRESYPDVWKLRLEDRMAVWNERVERLGFPDPGTIRVNHPDFRYTTNGGKLAFPVVVFERSMWRKPTNEEIADFHKRKTIVESLGGTMTLRDYQIAGEQPPFTEEDCAEMERLTLEVLPEGWIVRETWNGVDTWGYSLSVCREEQVND